MTAQERVGTRAGAGYSAHRAGTQRANVRNAGVRAEAGIREETPVVYIYGDRICRKSAKQRQLYKTYGTAAGFSPEKEAAERRTRGTAVPPRRKTRRKIAIDSIINLFDSIEQRGKDAIEAAKQNAIMRKKFIEHRRGFLLALFVIASLAAFVALVYNLFFGIRTIYAENTVHYTEAEIIAASGVESGDGLYSFRADRTEQRITFYCPYIRSVDVTRTIPNRIGFAVESDTAVYFADVYGEKLVLSEGLRVLGTYDPAAHGGLTELYLPEIRSSVAGRVITFADARAERHVRDTLGLLRESGLWGRINMADLRDSYDVTMHCDGLYVLRFKGEKDLAAKIKLAEKSIADPAFQQGTPAEIDLSVVGEASVRYDYNLDLKAQ